MYAKKSLGQHFLTNKNIVAKIVAAGAVTETDMIFEIGPGTGVLTRALLETGATVVALEADVRAIEILETEFVSEVQSGQLRVVHADIRSLDLETFYTQYGFTADAFKVIANIPYYISGLLFETILSARTKPTLLVFLVQKEVAERIARSEKESLLSLSVKAFGVPRYISTVAKGNFSPPPKVDSAILLVSDISNTTQKHFKDVCETDLFAVIKTGLASKRKQLLGNLTKLLPRADLERIFSTLGLQLDIRGEDIPLETWVTLTSHIVSHSK